MSLRDLGRRTRKLPPPPPPPPADNLTSEDIRKELDRLERDDLEHEVGRVVTDDEWATFQREIGAARVALLAGLRGGG